MYNYFIFIYAFRINFKLIPKKQQVLKERHFKEGIQILTFIY